MIDLNHHLIIYNQILATKKLIPKELYSLSIALKNELPKFQKYFCNIFPNLEVEWKEIYLLPCKVSTDTNLQMFHYKYWTIFYILINSFSFLIKKILNCVITVDYKMRQLNKIFEESKFPIKLWSDLKDYCQYSFDLPILNPQSATFGFFKFDPNLVILFNHILLLYKYYIYSSRDSSKLSFTALLKNI